jgi:hypothetical protein
MLPNIPWRRLSLYGTAIVALVFAFPLSSQTHPVFEFFVVSGSNNDVPPMIDGTTDLEDSLNIQICEELTKGHAAGVIAEQLHAPPPILQSHIDALLKAELLRRDAAGRYTATYPIIHREDAQWFAGIDKPLIGATVRSIEARQQELRARFREVLHLDVEPERALSLVLFGDVLFDRWQTGHVQKEFLQGYPPPRDGKMFYLAALEKVPGTIGSLGIYTHTEMTYGDVKVVAYGHTADLNPFELEKTENVSHLLQAYVGFVHGSSPPMRELKDIGFVKAGRPAVAVVTQSEYARLPEITSSFSDELLRLLNADRPKIIAAYQSSSYAGTVSFQEFALWWYHFYDAAVVGRLIQDGVIVVPPEGFATLIVIPG